MAKAGTRIFLQEELIGLGNEPWKVKSTMKFKSSGADEAKLGTAGPIGGTKDFCASGTQRALGKTTRSARNQETKWWRA